MVLNFCSLEVDLITHLMTLQEKSEILQEDLNKLQTSITKIDT